KLGWIDPATLRVFAVDPGKREFQLLAESGPDPERQCAYAYIDQPGVYGVIGLPSDEAVLETVRMFARLHPGSGKSEPGSLQERIYNVVLRAQDTAGTRTERLRPPGGGGTVDDFCTALDVPPGGLPEGQLLDGPPPSPPPSGMGSWLCIGPRNINGCI